MDKISMPRTVKDKRMKSNVLSIFFLGLCVCFLFAQSVQAGDYYLPADSGVINIQKDFGAKGDGESDDTESIRAAIRFAIDRQDRTTAPPFIFFPKGTYMVSGPIESRIGTGGWSNGWRCGMILVGEDKESTVIKLKDGLPAYQDKEKPEALLRTGSENPQNPDGAGGQGFRHSLMNLTFDVGRGNPGAVGIDYFANNRGLIENVTVRSSDPDKAGAVGYLMGRNEPGPSFVKNLTIDGFDVGIRATPWEYCVTFEDLRMTGQREHGILVGNMTLWMRNVSYEGKGPFAELRSGNGTVYLENATLNGGGSHAILNKGVLVMKNVSQKGFGSFVKNENGNKGVLNPEPTKPVAFYSSHPTAKVFGKSESPLDLPIEETPSFHSSDPADWVNAATFGATPNKEDDDDAPAIQKSIDAGKPIVYLPVGAYHVGEPIRLRGGVRKIMGMTSSVHRKKGYEGDLFVFEGGDIICEHINGFGPYRFTGKGTWTLTHMDFGGSGVEVMEGGSGKFFITDVISPDVVVRKGVDLWARQLNCEHAGHVQVTNDGSNAWIFGLKTEHPVTALRTLNGGSSELVAMLFPSQGKAGEDVPGVIVEDSRTSGMIITGRNIYDVFVREKQGGETRDIPNSTGVVRGSAKASIPWYVSGE